MQENFDNLLYLDTFASDVILWKIARKLLVKFMD